MIQLRWMIEKWTEHGEFVDMARLEEPVLQYRTIKNLNEVGLQEPIYTDWIDVETEYVEI